MSTPILGLHHVTAIAGNPQTNVEFYTGVLGLRLIKKNVNFDDPGTYHLYYGDGVGSPGTIMTFFPWPGVRRGVIGTGQTSTTAFAVPEQSLASAVRSIRRVSALLEQITHAQTTERLPVCFERLPFRGMADQWHETGIDSLGKVEAGSYGPGLGDLYHVYPGQANRSGISARRRAGLKDQRVKTSERRIHRCLRKA